MKLELHMHSTYSDGFDSVEKMVARVKELGLDGFALTEHDTVAGNNKAKKAAKKHGLEFIPGIEVGANEGHVVGLEINKNIKKGPAVEVVEKIHDLGGIAIAPHPYDFLRKSVKDLVKELKFDYIETFNARVPLPYFNRKAKEVAKEKRLKGVSASDAHLISEVGLGVVEVDSLESFYKGKVKIYREKWAGLGLLTIEKVRRILRKYSTN